MIMPCTVLYVGMHVSYLLFVKLMMYFIFQTEDDIMAENILQMDYMVPLDM